MAKQARTYQDYKNAVDGLSAELSGLISETRDDEFPAKLARLITKIPSEPPGLWDLFVMGSSPATVLDAALAADLGALLGDNAALQPFDEILGRCSEAINVAMPEIVGQFKQVRRLHKAGLLGGSRIPEVLGVYLDEDEAPVPATADLHENLNALTKRVEALPAAEALEVLSARVEALPTAEALDVLSARVEALSEEVVSSRRKISTLKGQVTSLRKQVKA